MDKLPVGQLPDLQQSNNDDEIMVITNSEYSQLKKEKISDLITDFTSTNENNALTKGTDGKMFVTDFGNASNITEGTLPVSVLPDIPKDLLPAIETSDLPVSGVTADTYAYPSSVTVNAQGQVTAIEEGTPSGSNANTDLSNITDAGKEVIKENSGGSGLEIGDIGIALYVDETKGLRRYLNGQIVDRNTNTEAFFTRLQKITTLYPSLLCTEEEWQTAKTLSAFGQVGKFVFNYSGDEVVSVRIPAIVNVQGLFDLQNAGLTVDAGLPNIRGKVSTFRSSSGAYEGALISEEGDNLNAGGASASGFNIILDASNYNPIYSDDVNTVQQEAIQYPYFIQVATGAEYEEPVINEYTVTSAYSYGMSQYYPGIMNNNSWLRSNGQYNSGAVYVGLYNWILEQVNSGVEGFKGVGYAYTSGDDTYYISTATPTAGATVYGDSNGICLPITTVTTISENSISFTNGSDSVTATRSSSGDKAITDDYWITDYDYVINTTDETFRLPPLDGSEDLVGDDANILSTDYSSSSLLTLEKNGTLAAKVGGQYLSLTNISNGVEVRFPNDAYSSGGSSIGAIDGKRGDVIRIMYVGNLSGLTFAPFKGNGNLYYYCCNVEQNTQLVNVARIEEKLVDKVDMQQAAWAGGIDFSREITPALNSTFTPPTDGWIRISLDTLARLTYTYIYLGTSATGVSLGGFSNEANSGYSSTQYIRLNKGETYYLYSNNASNSRVIFYPCKGVTND